MTAMMGSAHVDRGVPTIVVHVGVATVAAAASVALVPVTFWLVIALALGLGAAIVPRLYTAWPLMVLLALTQLAREPSAADWRPYALVAGLHLIHVLVSLAQVLPVRGTLEARSLTRMLRRYVVVQVPCQALLAVVLVVFSPTTVDIAVPWLAPVGAVALILLAAALVVPLVRRREAGEPRR